MKFANVRVANISHLRSKYFTAKRFHLPARANFVAYLLYGRYAVARSFYKAFQMGGYTPVLGFFSFQPIKELGKRQDQKACKEIADAVHQIEGESRCDPCKHAVKIEAEKECLRGCVKHAVEKSEKTANGREYRRANASRHTARE